MRWTIVCALLLVAAEAHAVMAPEVYEKARENAPFHVQVAVREVKVPAATPGACTVSGDVVRIFRDAEGALSEGAAVTFPIFCTRAGDEIPIGGVLWADADGLAAARFIEAFLLGSPPDLDVALYQARIIEAATDAPQAQW